MKQSNDPAVHQEREKAFFEHVKSVLNDARLRVLTRSGPRSVAAGSFPHVIIGQPGVARGESVKRLMMQLNLSDRSLQQRMPIGERLPGRPPPAKFLDVQATDRAVAGDLSFAGRSAFAGTGSWPDECRGGQRAAGAAEYRRPVFLPTVVLMSTSLVFTPAAVSNW